MSTGHALRFASLLASMTIAWLMVACEQRSEQLEELGIDEQEARRILAEIAARSASASAALPPPPAPPKAKMAGKEEAQAPEPAKTSSQRWVVDEMVDIAPAAPLATHARGVFLLDAQNRLWLAKLGSLQHRKKPGPSPVAAIPDNDVRFALGRGPSIAGDYAYWVREHYLLRRPIVPPYEPLEVLADDARVGTRASALSAFLGGKKRNWVVYVAFPPTRGGPLRAKLWHGNDRHLVLTPDGSSTLNAQLVLAGNEARVFSLEARTGMSSVHSRRVVATHDLPVLGEDQVVWVGGSANGLSELRAFGSSSQDVFGLLPIEKDMAHFGMAVLSFNLTEPPAPAEIAWADFQNGLDPAPVDAARVCGTQSALYARPQTAEPHGPQELVLAELKNGRPEPGIVLARSKAFYDLSLVSLKGGALLAYVADHRSWAQTVRCR